MAKSFQQRLVACGKAGNLTPADLSRWFDRPYATVRTWLNGTEPGGGPIDKDHAHQMLGLLELLIKRKQGFPVPRLSGKKRIAHVAGVRKAMMNA